MESYGSGKTLVRKKGKMVERRPATHVGIYKLLDHVPQGKIKVKKSPKDQAFQAKVFS